MAQDSMNTVTLALHNPPLPVPPHGCLNGPGVQGEPDDDHEGGEGVKGKSKRMEERTRQYRPVAYSGRHKGYPLLCYQCYP